MSKKDFSGHPRYRILRPLGRGGMGVVYEAEDLERETRVALKTLRRRGSQALFSLKREFRSLVDVHHANLATLYDLYVEGEDPFFTMELVDGVDLRTYCSRDDEDPVDLYDATVVPGATEPAYDEQRLRRVLPQLGEGLQALHEAGVLHRDIKPTNVLVRVDGRVKILDFGLVVGVDDLDEETSAGKTVGTLAYMSPEQALGEVDLTPASDWYSVGTMVYELLTGHLPFAGVSLKLLMEKQRSPAPPPRRLIPSTPEDLDSLCVNLLRRSPADRPRSAVVLERLRALAGQELETRRSVEPDRQLFHGRKEEIAVLRGASERVRSEGAQVVLLRGPSGIGKTAVANESFRQLAEQRTDLVLLAGRCYERESVPYRAMDGVIDELSRHWRRLPAMRAGALLPREGGRLRQLFPVLGRVPAVAGEPEPMQQEDPDIRRTRGYAALRETFHRLAGRRPLVIFLDDLQWVDRDSVHLLTDLLRPPDPPPLLLVLSSRDYSAERTPILTELVRGLQTTLETLEIGPLPLSACRELAGLFAGSADAEQIDRLAEESDGNPFLLGELARYVQSLGGAAQSLRLEDVFARRQASLNRGARRLLECICLAGDPLPHSVVRQAANLAPEEFQEALATLSSGHLTRSGSGEEESRFEPYHDRIREIVVATLSPSRRTLIHRRLAEALDASGEASESQLARHWQGAGEHLRAAQYARAAGDHAAASTDFDGAAGWYRSALEQGEHKGEQARQLWTQLGEALGHAGRPVESAEAFEQAAAGADRARALDLRRRAMEQLLGGGYVAPGLDAARALLADVGLSLPGSPAATILRIIANQIAIRIRGIGWTPRAASETSADARTQAQIALTVGTTLANVDTLRANAVLGRGLRLALDLGVPAEVVQATTVASCMASALGQGKRAESLLRVLEDAARLDGSRRSLGKVAGAREFLAFFVENRWQAAIEYGDESLEHFWQAGEGRIWERDACLFCRSYGRLYGGDLRKLDEEVSKYVQAATRSGNRLLSVNLRTAFRIRHLIHDDPDRAEEDLKDAIESWLPVEVSFQLQHWYALLGRCEVALYRGAVDQATADLEENRKRFERSLLTHVARVRCEYRHVSGRIALARAAQAKSSARRQEDLRLAKKLATALERDKFPMGETFAMLLRSSAARIEGNQPGAVELLRATLARLEDTETRLYAAATRRQLGATLGGDRGAEMIEEADRWMTDQGIVRPDRMAAMLVPGWSHPG